MKVHVAVKALLNEKFTDSGLIAHIYRRVDEKRYIYVRHIIMPMADYISNTMRYVEELSNAEPGKYLLQLLLPSGNVVTKHFEIEPDKEMQLVIDLPHEGPHEWTSLQALAGQFTREAQLTDGFTRKLSATSPGYVRLSADPQNGYALSLVKQDENVSGSIISGQNTISKLAQLIREKLDARKAIQCFGKSRDVASPTFEERDYAIFKFAHSGILAPGEQDPREYVFGPSSDLSRNYLVQKSASGATLICMPTPWTMPSGQAEVELLLKKNSFAGSLDYTITIGDPMINTVLGYINIGAIHEAAVLFDFEKARQMLAEKITCPLAASIGGYLLLFGMNRKEYSSKADDWKRWIQNLDRWFVWLPDGAILHAALHFILGDLNHEEAHAALMSAYDRGLPFFTFGLKLMMDGLRYFIREGYQEDRKRLSELEMIANQTDPSQPFLSVTFSQHW